MDDSELTELQQAAVMMHEMFLACCQAGFSPEHAIQLIVGMMSATKTLIPPPPSPNGKVN
jgi:hypothetical protein